MYRLSFRYIILVSLLYSFFQPSIASYNVVTFGAKSDGKTDSTGAFLRAWRAACSSTSLATIYVPRGTFLIKTVTFNGPCRSRIVFQIDGTIVAPSGYNSLGNAEFWIMFYKVNRVNVHGGTFDANGAAFWACRKAGKSCPTPTKVHTYIYMSSLLYTKFDISFD